MKTAGIPIYIRYNEELQKKKIRLDSLKKSVERQRLKRNPSPSFNPKINKRSKRELNFNKCLESNTKDFLRRKSIKMNELKEDLRVKENKELTFRP